MAPSLVDGVILSVAVLRAQRRISPTTLSATGDPSARRQERGLFGMSEFLNTEKQVAEAGVATETLGSE